MQITVRGIHSIFYPRAKSAGFHTQVWDDQCSLCLPTVSTNNTSHELHARFVIYCGLEMAILIGHSRGNFCVNETAWSTMGK